MFTTKQKEVTEPKNTKKQKQMNIRRLWEMLDKSIALFVVMATQVGACVQAVYIKYTQSLVYQLNDNKYLGKKPKKITYEKIKYKDSALPSYLFYYTIFSLFLLFLQLWMLFK